MTSISDVDYYVNNTSLEPSYMPVGDYNYYDIMQSTGNGDAAGIFSTVADFAANGSSSIGDLSEFLLRAGYTVEAIRNGLNNISAVVGAPTPVVQYATDELRYLNNNMATRQNATGLWLLAGLAAVLLISARD